MRYDQLALVAGSMTVQELLCRQHGGEWTEDLVRTEGVGDHGQRIANLARLAFNYTSWPMEFEVLHYLEGWNWHGAKPQLEGPYTSHFGVHVKNDHEILEARRRWPVLQEVITVSHTNPVIKDSRRYRYVIFDSRKELGTELKLIQRLTIAQAAMTLAQMFGP